MQSLKFKLKDYTREVSAFKSSTKANASDNQKLKPANERGEEEKEGSCLKEEVKTGRACRGAESLLQEEFELLYGFVGRYENGGGFTS